MIYVGFDADGTPISMDTNANSTGKPPLAAASGSEKLFHEMLTMLLIFKADIETGLWPTKDSPCHIQLTKTIKQAESLCSPNKRP